MIKVYQVGGSVRDEIMGKPSSDLDYVIVGATPEDLIKKGYSQVGSDFPVFLHPETHDEYALARTERKTGHGYGGFETYFDTSVTLEEDLGRRDLTINSMAKDSKGNIIDPYNGQEDIKNKVLKHVSPAFSEDPLRILRVARFAARFGFSIHPETMVLMQSIHNSGETKFLTKERIWKEYSRVLTHDQVSLFYKCLDNVGVGKNIFYSFETYKKPEIYLSSDFDHYLKDKNIKDKILFNILPTDDNQLTNVEFEKNLQEISAPKEFIDHIKISVNIRDSLCSNLRDMDFFFNLLITNDSLRRKERFINAYTSVSDFMRHNHSTVDLPNIEKIESWIKATDINAQEIAKSGDKKTIAERIYIARKESFNFEYQKTERKILKIK